MKTYHLFSWRRCCAQTMWFATFTAIAILIQPLAGEAWAQDEPSENVLSFSFNGAPWREVLDWLAEESDLALHLGDLPSGSFTYSDPQTFSTDEAISRINLFLIPEGYSAVRRGKLLTVITLGDPRSMQQLDAMAPLISVSELDQRSDNEVVKCMIPLGDLNAEEATAELKPLMLMSSPVVLPKSKQLMVVETAAKLRSVISILKVMNEPPVDNTVVKRLTLKHADFESLMLIAAPHLGLEQDETSNFDISITTDLAGKNLFVTGTQEVVEKLESLMAVIDVPMDEPNPVEGLVLKSHPVESGNLQSVYDVLLTILSDQQIRLTMEPKTTSIVALADASVQEKITQTIAELKAPAVEFAVVPMQTLDPYFAVNLLGEMFGIRSEFDEDTSDDESRAPPPKIDADSENRRLFVRGTKEQIRQIRQVIESLEQGVRTKDELRVVPLKGLEGQRILELAKQSWNRDNDVLILPPSEDFRPSVIERAINPDVPSNQRAAKEHTSESDEDGRFDVSSPSPFRPAPDFVSVPNATTVQGSEMDTLNGKKAPLIQSRMTPQGIMIQSDDTDALDEFEDYLRSIGASGGVAISAPVAFYLKFVGAEEAVRMLADLIDGENALATSPAGSLVSGGTFASGSGYYGSLVFSRDGQTTVSAGSATIVSDARLNRLIVQGTTEDVAMVEKYLKLIDKGDSISSIETFGRSHIIELENAKATDVAEVVRQAFRGRIAGEGQENNSNQRRPERGGEGESGGSDGEQAKEGGNERTVEKPTRGRQAEMTVAVHEPSNSLIITAPDQLFAEVEKLIRSVDQKSEQVIQVIPAGDGVDLESIMQRIMGAEPQTTRRSTTDRNRSRSTTSGRDGRSR